MPAARGVLEHRVHLRAGNPGKPAEELLNRRAALEVLEQPAIGRAARQAHAVSHYLAHHGVRARFPLVPGFGL